MKYLLSLSLLLFSHSPFASDIPILKEPYTWERVKEYHKQLGSRHFPSLQRIIDVDLNKDGLTERFMLVRPYARGGTYTLFLYHDSMWHPMTQIEMSHLQYRILDNGKNGWHDFITYVPQWRGKLVWAFHYTFDGTNYQLKSKQDMEWP